MPTVAEKRTESGKKYLGSARISSFRVWTDGREPTGSGHPLNGRRTMWVTGPRALLC